MMEIAVEHKQLIKDHYDGLLSPDQELALQHLVEENPNVAEAFKTMGIVVDSIKTLGFRQMLEEFERKYSNDVE